MTKKELIELYLADLNNLVPDSDAKRSRIIDLEDELEALSQHDVSKQREQLISFADTINVCDGDNKKIGKLVDLYLKSN